jgi:hypothetical protein
VFLFTVSRMFSRNSLPALPCAASLCFFCFSAAAHAHDPSDPERKRPSEAIQDNSFLVEEAYNQEPGVVQHIFTGFGSVNKLSGPDDREWAPSFTQEWPVFSQAHQFSYTVPYSFAESGNVTENGVGDILLNYRFQALTESARVPAFAPRLSVVLPTGDDEKGFGNGEVGYQINLPFSKVLNGRWSAHFNAGATCFPDVRGERLVSYNLGASVIYAVNDNFNLMVEAIGAWDESVAELGGTGREFTALISPGIRYAFNFSNDAQIVAGIAAPIGLSKAAPDYGIFLYLSIEHFFARPRETAPVRGYVKR